MKKIVVDPALGSRYGFPKVWDKTKNPDFKDWLLKEGYPLVLIEKNYPYSMWEYKEDEEDLKNNG